MFLYLLFLSFFVTFLTPQSVSAITPTITPSTASTSSADQNELKQDVQTIRDAVKVKVQEKLKNITSDVGTTDPNADKKALIGTIIQVDGNNLTIDHQNKTRNLTISSDTVIINDKKVKAKAESLKVGQAILAMGYLNNDVLETKRIVFTSADETENNNEIIIGNIVDISKTSSVLVLIPSNNKNNQYQIKTDSKTTGLNKLYKKFDLDDLTTGQKVIAIVSPESKTSKTYLASKIINLDSPSSTVSATPTATKK